MKKISVFLFFLFVQFIVYGQTMNVTLSQKDTALCIGSSLRVGSTFYVGSFKYIGTYGTSDYFVDTLSRSWTDARTAAQSNGMDLWMIDDANENNNVYYMIPNRTQTDAVFWLGLTQDTLIEQLTGRPDSGWHWIDGRSLDTTFSYWSSGQPDDAFGFNIGANFASIGLNVTGNRWSDMTDVLPAQYSGYAIAERPHAPMSFLWSNGTKSWYIDLTPTISGVYNLAVTYDNVTVTSTDLNIIVNKPKAIAAFSQDPSSYYCLKKNNIVLINSTSTTDVNTTYIWDFGDGTTSNSYSVNHQYTGASTFTISLKATDANGCFTKVNANVDIKFSPDPFSISYTAGSNIFCDRDSVFLKASVNQTLPAVYNWYLLPSTTKLVSGNSYTAKVGGTYLLESVLSNGCRDSASVLVTVNPLPGIPSIALGTGYTNIFCQTDSTKLQANAAGSVSRYIWYTSAIPVPIAINGSNAQVYFAKAPSGMSTSIVAASYLVKVVDSKGCVSDFSAPFSVSTKPSPAALITAGTSPTTFCEGDSVQIFIASKIEPVNEWFKDNLTYLTGPTNVILKSTGTYKVKVTNSFSCSVFSNAINVVVNKYPTIPTISPDLPVPEILPSGQINICTGSSLIMRTPSVTGGTYQWFYNSLPISGYTGLSATINKAGTYSVNVKVAGCTTFSQVKTVGLLPLPNGILNQPSVTTICNGYNLPITASNAFGYQWYLNSAVISGAVSSTFTATTPGVYKVEFSTDKGCKLMSSNFVNLTLIKKPTAGFTYDLYCINTPSNFSNQSVTTNSGTVDYLWRFQNGMTDNSINPTHTFTSSGLYRATLVVTPSACPMLADSISSNIEVEVPTPGVSYTPINTLAGQPQSIIARSFGDFYEWKPTTGLNSPFIRIPILTPSTEQLYTVKITDRAGCVTIDSQLVRIFDEQEVFVAGGFTPNNDGINDRVYPILVGITSFNYFKVFNRWGNLVFQTNSTDPLKGWDGRYQGKDQPADTYTFVLEARGINGRLIRKSGSIVLIR